MWPASSTAIFRTTKKPDPSGVVVGRRLGYTAAHQTALSNQSFGLLPAALVLPKRTICRKDPKGLAKKRGAIAQLGERFNGIEEVVGSIPSGSTKHSCN